MHDNADELYLILAGEGSVTVDGQTMQAKKHDVFHILAGS